MEHFSLDTTAETFDVYNHYPVVYEVPLVLMLDGMRHEVGLLDAVKVLPRRDGGYAISLLTRDDPDVAIPLDGCFKNTVLTSLRSTPAWTHVLELTEHWLALRYPDENYETDDFAEHSTHRVIGGRVA